MLEQLRGPPSGLRVKQNADVQFVEQGRRQQHPSMLSLCVVSCVTHDEDPCFNLLRDLT